MTTKPSAKRYHIRRMVRPTEGPAAQGLVSEGAARQAQADPESPFEPVEDGFPSNIFPPLEPQDTPARQVLQPKAPEPQTEPALTARQLRMARRVAQKHGIDGHDDHELVQKLREQGIDPFQRVNVLEMIKGEGARAPSADAPAAGLPQAWQGAPVPSPAQAAETARLHDIERIQQDIVRRRRHRFALMLARLAFFVMLPTLIAGLYYYVFATPLYATKSEFVIQQAQGGGSGGMGGLFAGTQFATSQDSITVQSYLQSRDAMLRLDADHGFKAHFSQPQMDTLQRLAPGASNEDAYKLYRRNVKIAFDPTEGIIKMEVIAADPETSAAFSRALISYAEEQVDHLTQRLREDQMKGARDSYEDAEAKMLAAQGRVLSLQEQLGVLDVATESSVVMSQVANFETQVREKQLQLDQLLANPAPNQARVEGVRGDIARLQATIADLRASLTESGAETTSLAAISGELRVAESDLETRQMLLAESLKQMETARIEANKQVRYLSLGVSPTPPDEPTYPRAFENTLLALFIFAGIYLMLSLTAAILREQVSA